MQEFEEIFAVLKETDQILYKSEWWRLEAERSGLLLISKHNGY